MTGIERIGRGGIGSAVVGVAVLAAGCQAPADRMQFENFRQIRATVSSQADVAAAIGEPSTEFEGKWLYERPEKHLRAIIDFDTAGRVTRAQWIDATGAVWEDTGDAGTPPGSKPPTSEPPRASGTGRP